MSQKLTMKKINSWRQRLQEIMQMDKEGGELVPQKQKRLLQELAQEMGASTRGIGFCSEDGRPFGYDASIAELVDNINRTLQTATSIKNSEYTRRSICITLMAVVVAIIALYFSARTNKRAEKLFVGQNKPLVDVTPVGIFQNEGGTHCTIEFSVVNYSGFTAYDIGIDVKYGKGNDWILKWNEAYRDNETKKKEEIKEGVVIEKRYLSAPRLFIEKLEAGGTATKDFEGSLYILGSLPLEEKFKDSKWKEGYPIFVRVTWQNENKHTFDEIHKYRLICTREGLGRSFTFIPDNESL